jgi:hypothetical protein
MIRTIFTAAFLSIFMPLFSKDCKLEKQADAYTKEVKLSTGFIRLDGGSLTIDADSKEITFLFTVSGTDKCYDNNSTAYIFFEGSKSKASNRNNGTMNCEGLFQFVFRNSASTTSLLQRMTTQKLNHISFTGNDKKETIISFGPEQQEIVMKLANCLVTEAKTLIK